MFNEAVSFNNKKSKTNKKRNPNRNHHKMMLASGNSYYMSIGKVLHLINKPYSLYLIANIRL